MLQLVKDQEEERITLVAAGVIPPAVKRLVDVLCCYLVSTDLLNCQCSLDVFAELLPLMCCRNANSTNLYILHINLGIVTICLSRTLDNSKYLEFEISRSTCTC